MANSRTKQLELPFASRRELISRAQIALCDRPVTYTVRRSSRRRSISLTIDERGLRVGAPFHSGQHEIDALLRRHEAWIVRKLAEWQARCPVAPRWTPGEVLMLLGAPLRLVLVPGCGAPVRRGHELGIGIETGDPASAVIAWMKEEAAACFNARVTAFCAAFDVPAPAVSLSSARTRWGSCHAAGRVRLNWRLVQFPLRLIDYVVVHELAHLREMNHSARFWRIVARILPDYASRRRELRTEAQRYLRV